MNKIQINNNNIVNELDNKIDNLHDETINNTQKIESIKKSLKKNNKNIINYIDNKINNLKIRNK